MEETECNANKTPLSAEAANKGGEKSTAEAHAETKPTSHSRHRSVVSKHELRSVQIPGTNRKRNRPEEDIDGDDLKQDELPPEHAPTILPDGTVEFSLSAIHEHLICDLCTGYFRDPYTITDCLHTFCKSCLFYAVACGCYECPTCHIFIGSDPTKVAVLDSSLKELIDKVIFPSMVEQERLEEEAFYEGRGIPTKSEHASRLEEPKRRVGRGGSTFPATTATVSGVSITESLHMPFLPAKAISSHPRHPVVHQKSEELQLSLLPEIAQGGEKALSRLQNPCLTVSGRLRMSQLKKHIIQKLGFDDSPGPGAPRIDILCDGVPLGDEISMSFVRRLLWHHEDSEPLLTYRMAKIV